MKEIKINLGTGNFGEGGSINNNNNNQNNFYGGNPEFNNSGFNPVQGVQPQQVVNPQYNQMGPMQPVVNQGPNVSVNPAVSADDDGYYAAEILKYIFGDRNDPNNMLSDSHSEVYHAIVYSLLFDGISKMKDNEFEMVKSQLSSSSNSGHYDILNAKGYSQSKDGSRKGYSVTFENNEYSITFYVGISNTSNGIMPALDNFVYSTMQNNNAYYSKGIILDREFISGYAPFIYPVLERYGVQKNELMHYVETYPSLLLYITDRIVNFVNEFGDNAYLMSLAKSGIISFGGVTIYPDIDNTGVMCRMELDNKIRYRLKTDINFSEADDRKTRMDY